MAVKLHGGHGAHGAHKATLVNGGTVTPLRAGATGAPAGGKQEPADFKAPWTVGRVLYFLVMVTGLTLGGKALFAWGRWVTATGVVERDVDRLAPREKGRITRVGVQAGDHVKAGQPLVWLDYSGPDGFISDAAQRVQQRDDTLEAMRERRREIDRLSAQAHTQLSGYASMAAGLEPQRRTLRDTQLSALRLKREGAATEAEVAQVQVQLQSVEQQISTARNQAESQGRVLAQLRSEAAALDRALKQKAPPPKTADVGVVTASRDGVVAYVAAHAGEVVGPEDAVVLIADDAHVRVRAFVQPKDAQALVPGKAAEVKLPSGEILKAEVERVGLLASIAPQPTAPSLGKPQQPSLTAQAAPPVDPNAAFLLADVSVLEVPAAIAPRLAAGSPCEVRVERSWQWLRELIPFGG